MENEVNRKTFPFVCGYCNKTFHARRRGKNRNHFCSISCATAQRNSLSQPITEELLKKAEDATRETPKNRLVYIAEFLSCHPETVRLTAKKLDYKWEMRENENPVHWASDKSKNENNRTKFEFICENCQQKFWRRSHGKNRIARFCSKGCARKGVLPEICKIKYPITLELLKEAEDQTKNNGGNRHVYIARKLGCDVATVGFAAKRLGYKWEKRPRECYLYRTTEVENNYAKSVGCVVCGEMRSVDAAHYKPASSGGLSAIENIIPLCPNHHRIFDRRDRPKSSRSYSEFTLEELEKLNTFLTLKNLAPISYNKCRENML